MARNLVIVESPAKAKAIGRYLGDSYAVKASVGHVRDLPEKDWESISKTALCRNMSQSRVSKRLSTSYVVL